MGLLLAQWGTKWETYWEKKIINWATLFTFEIINSKMNFHVFPKCITKKTDIVLLSSPSQEFHQRVICSKSNLNKQTECNMCWYDTSANSRCTLKEPEDSLLEKKILVCLTEDRQFPYQLTCHLSPPARSEHFNNAYLYSVHCWYYRKTHHVPEYKVRPSTQPLTLKIHGVYFYFCCHLGRVRFLTP